VNHDRLGTTFLSMISSSLPELKMIIHFFRNLEYVQLGIFELKTLSILISKLRHLIYANICDDVEVGDEKIIEDWLHQNAAILKLT